MTRIGVICRKGSDADGRFSHSCARHASAACDGAMRRGVRGVAGLRSGEESGAGSYELACILAPLPPLERDVLPQETAAGASKRWLCQSRPHHMQVLLESARTQHTHAYAVSSGEGKR